MYVIRSRDLHDSFCYVFIVSQLVAQINQKYKQPRTDTYKSGNIIKYNIERIDCMNFSKDIIHIEIPPIKDKDGNPIIIVTPPPEVVELI